MRIVVCILTTIVILFAQSAGPKTAFPLDVYPSTLSKNAVCVHLSGADVATAKSSKTKAGELAAQTATKMINLAGIPSSLTAKAATLPVWSALCGKYTYDIYEATKQAPPGSNVTLQYGVDIAGVKRVWAASAAADLAVPGTPAYKAALAVLNAFDNALLVK